MSQGPAGSGDTDIGPQGQLSWAGQATQDKGERHMETDSGTGPAPYEQAEGTAGKNWARRRPERGAWQ